MRRDLRRLIAAVARWGFTIMLVPRRGSIKRLSVPWLGVIGLILICSIIGYLGFDYVHKLSDTKFQSISIRKLEAKRTRYEAENRVIKPALNSEANTQALKKDLQNIMVSLNTVYTSLRHKAPNHLASRGGIRYPAPYKLPDTVIAAADGEVSLLDTLTANTDSLDQEINRQLKQARKLKEQLLAYERQLDHTPNIWPVRGRLTSDFGGRTDPFTKRFSFHHGIDLATNTGTLVHTAADGVIVSAGWRSGYGLAVEIKHGYGYITLYGHNSKLLVEAGETVKKGQTIALVGSTGRSSGSHCHFEIWINGNKVNPLTYLK